MLGVTESTHEVSMTNRIIRFFRATIRPGSERQFQAFFLDEALAMVRRQEGLISVQVGLPMEGSPSQFSMVTTWRDLASLKKFAGAEWEQAVIDPREAPLIQESFVSHYYDAGI